MSELSPERQFQDKIKERLRDDIGNMIPDDALSKMIDRAMDSLFSPDNLYVTDNYGRNTENLTWFHKELKAHLSNRVDKYLREWFSENENKIMDLIVECYAKGAIEKAVAGAVMSMISQPIFEMQNAIQNNIRQIAGQGQGQGY